MNALVENVGDSIVVIERGYKELNEGAELS